MSLATIGAALDTERLPKRTRERAYQSQGSTTYYVVMAQEMVIAQCRDLCQTPGTTYFATLETLNAKRQEYLDEKAITPPQHASLKAALSGQIEEIEAIIILIEDERDREEREGLDIS